MRDKHVVAAVIAASNGYFSPEAARHVVNDVRKGRANYSEWIIDWACKAGKSEQEVTRELVSWAIQIVRRYKPWEYVKALNILRNEKARQELVFASWM